MKNGLYFKELFENETILAGQTLENAADPLKFRINRQEAGPGGSFSLWLKLSGTGELKAEAKCSGNNGVDYVPIVPELLVGALAGEYLIPFAVPLCTEMTILLTETGTANDIVIEECNVLSR